MNRLCDLNLKQLKEYIKNKDVYCFGCGIQGKRMAMLFENWGLQKNLKGYIDNDRKKIGTQIEIENNIYNIYMGKIKIYFLKLIFFLHFYPPMCIC